MNKHYLNKATGFRELYWSNSYSKTTPELNGFSVYPTDVYNAFLIYLYKDGRIIDLGCGTALLLKHITQNSKFNIEPYGVDFLNEAIVFAKEITLPEYESNFFCVDIGSFYTSIKFDYIILEPSLLLKEDRFLVTERLFTYLNSVGKIIAYSYHDSMKAYTYSHLSEYFGNENYTFREYNSYNEYGVDIAVLQKKASNNRINSD